MTRLLSDDVLDALVDIFDPNDPNRYQEDPALAPGWRIDRTTGERVYSAAWLSDESDAVEGHSKRYPKPDELEIRRRERDIAEMDRSRRAGRRFR